MVEEGGVVCSSKGGYAGEVGVCSVVGTPLTVYFPSWSPKISFLPDRSLFNYYYVV